VFPFCCVYEIWVWEFLSTQLYFNSFYYYSLFVTCNNNSNSNNNSNNSKSYKNKLLRWKSLTLIVIRIKTFYTFPYLSMKFKKKKKREILNRIFSHPVWYKLASLKSYLHLLSKRIWDQHSGPITVHSAILIQFNSIYLCAKLNSPEGNYKVSTGKKMGRVRSKKVS
jgi:hypothetical protein